MRLVLATILLAIATFVQTQLMTMADPNRMMAMPQMLLQNAAVQKELKLSGKQKTDLKKANDDFVKSMQSGSQSPTADYKAMEAKFAESERKLLEILDEPQRLRFRQVRYQVLGILTLTETEVQATLGLTDEQKASVASYDKEERNGYLESARKGPGAMKSWRNGRDKREETITKILSVEQAAKLKELFGKSFSDAKKIRG
jgi:hypothetical protein